MREHIFRIHHQLFMSEESVPGYIVLEVVQSRWYCTLILEMGCCNARTHFSHPPPRLYKWGECTRVCSFKSSSVQIVLQPILKMEPCNAVTHVSHPPPAFYERGECTRVDVFKSSWVQTVPHSNSENGTLNAITHCSHPPPCFYEWEEGARVYTLCVRGVVQIQWPHAVSKTTIKIGRTAAHRSVSKRSAPHRIYVAAVREAWIKECL
jgi:hypothetical protein